jgi:geranylgeranyl pyrophosphate synthase
MNEKYNIEERCRKILEDNGGFIADKARTILLEDSALRDLQPPLEFISKNWRDPLTPALMSLSCAAVGGQPEKTREAALAMSLINLSFRIWDDIIDKAQLDLFKPTLYGKFGEGTTLIIGGLASAKAFSILNQMNIEKEKCQTIIKLFWDFLVTMARAETLNLRLRSQKNSSSKEKFWKIETEASDLGTCSRIGAILGDGSSDEIRHLERCGLCLGIILELWKDFLVSLNLTLELAEKIRKGALPFALLWASERSERIQRKLDRITTDEKIEKGHIKQIVEEVLETGALDNTIRTMKRFAKKGKEELLKMERNDATRALRLVIEAQPQLFVESLQSLQK